MRTRWNSFWHGCEGQDVTEYTLLIAFMTVIGIAILLYTPESTTRIWGHVQTYLVKARDVAGPT